MGSTRLLWGPRAYYTSKNKHTISNIIRYYEYSISKKNHRARICLTDIGGFKSTSDHQYRIEIIHSLISVDQAVELRKKRVQESRARGAETLWHRRDAAWAKGASALQ